MQSKGIIGLLIGLARYIELFSLVEQIDMVAEAPDHHGGGLGRVEQARNDLNGGSMIGHSMGANGRFVYLIISIERKGCLKYI